MTARATPVVVKRYRETRFYDAGAARYLTIDDLLAWQATSLQFEVRDAQSGEDVTETVLSQAASRRVFRIN
jgi:polyhydroxyalkanoate synthesis regulator protein